MLINDETIKHLENLSMLNIKDKEGMKKKLAEVLTFMENLGGVEDVELLEDNVTNYREDIAIRKVDMEGFFKENPKVVGNSFEVPKIL